MSSQTPLQDPGGLKGFFNKLKPGKRAKKDKDKGSVAHESLSVPATGEEYESPTHSTGQSRVTTPFSNESNPPATSATASSALDPVQQTTQHRSAIRDSPTMGTGNDLDLERAPEPTENTLGPVVGPSTFEQRPASIAGRNDYAAGVIGDGNVSILPSTEQDLESTAGPIGIRALSPSAVDKLLPPLPPDAPTANLPMVDISTTSSADEYFRFLRICFPQRSNPSARVWFNAATGFGKTLLKKLPDFVDSNPVKAVAAVVKAAIEAAETVGANKDNLTRLSTKLESLAQLEGTEDGIPTGANEIHRVFKEALSNVSDRITDLKNREKVLRTISYEQYSKEIQGVFDTINDAVQAFQVQIASQIEAEAKQILAIARDEKLRRLDPSMSAYYDRVVEGQRIRREECTEGTRVEILDNISAWAQDDSPQSPLVYWLTGQAGSGKTTIAMSIAAKFSQATPGIKLSANFFCSRNTPETNTTRRIVPTIAYQLARSCDPFTQALIVPGKLDRLDAVSSPVREQLKSLFFVPWVQCEANRGHKRYLIIIDALDELKENGSAEFLDAVFTLFKASPMNGLKIFINSRSEDEIISRIQPFYSRTIRWLQEVPLKDVSGDIRIYLQSRLPTIGDNNLDKLTDIAGGLFIYAATAVRYLKPTHNTPIDEQVYRLEKFLKYPRHAGSDRPNFIVDELYRTIMVDALYPHMESRTLYMARLKAIHLILSTGERASAGTIAALFNTMGSGDFALTADVVMSVVQTDLHSVLYVKDDLIFWYHASFPDFIFNSSRSNFKFILDHAERYDFEFACDEDEQQTWLRNLCFNRLTGLKFNIASIPSSFNFDDDHSYNPDTLLLYSSLNWSHHLLITGDAGADDVEDFLRLRALFWIELMDVIKRVDDCISILVRARRWVQRHVDVDKAALDERLGEVIAFVKGFLQVESISLEDNSDSDSDSGSVEKMKLSTPHLYISHLAMWSDSPKIIQQWKENFRNLPRITHSHKDIPLIFTTDGQNLKKDERVAPEVQLEDDRITSVAFLNKGAQILSGYKDGSISIWDASTGALQVHLDIGGQQLSTQNNTTATTGFEDCVCVWNLVADRASPYWKRDAGASKGFWSITASADSTKIRSESLDETVYIWGLVSERWQLVSWFKSRAQGSVSPNGTYLINTSDVDNTDTTKINIHKVTPAGPQLICPPLKNTPSVAVYQHGSKLQIAYERKPHELVYLESLDGENHSFSQVEQNTLQEHTAVLPNGFRGSYYNLRPVTISPDRSTIGAGMVRLWNPVTGSQQQLPYGGHLRRHRSLAISEDNKHILSCDGMSICLWDISGGTKSALLREHTDSARDFQNWELQEDGWIVSSQTKDRLVWVPDAFWDHDSPFAVPETILLLSAKGYYSVDFSKSKLGRDWAKCYTPTSASDWKHF